MQLVLCILDCMVIVLKVSKQTIRTLLLMLYSVGMHHPQLFILTELKKNEHIHIILYYLLCEMSID